MIIAILSRSISRRAVAEAVGIDRILHDSSILRPSRTAQSVDLLREE